MLAADGKASTEVTSMAISSLQRLLSHDALSPYAVRPLLQKLEAQVDHGEVGIQVKILQTVLTLLSRTSHLNGPPLAQALTICFRLHANKNQIVCNTAGATLRQVSSMLFDQTAAELGLTTGGSSSDGDHPRLASPKLPRPSILNVKVSENDLPPASHDAYMLFCDLVSLTGSQSARWMDSPSGFSTAFGLELIEALLASHTAVFYASPLLLRSVKLSLCPTLGRLADSPNFAVFLRASRVSAILLRNFHSVLPAGTGPLLDGIIRGLEPSTPPWKKGVCLEILKSIILNPLLLRSLYLHYESGGAAAAGSVGRYAGLVAAVGHFVQSEHRQTKGAPRDVSVKAGLSKFFYLDHLAALDPPTWPTTPAPGGLAGAPPPSTLQATMSVMKGTNSAAAAVEETYLLSVAVESLIGLIDSLSALLSYGSKTDQSAAQVLDPSSEELLDALSVLRDMTEACWPSVLAALSVSLAHAAGDDLIQALLRSYQTFVNLAGLLGLTVPRDTFLTSLCKEAVPAAQPRPGFGLTSPPSARSFSGRLKAVSSLAALDPLGGGPLSGSGSQTDSPQFGAGAPAVLTSKNILACKALLNVAHCFGPILGSAWELILQTLEELDWILGSADTRGLGPGREAEYSILGSAVSGLFSSSQILDRNSLATMARALANVSQAALAEGGPAAGPHVHSKPQASQGTSSAAAAPRARTFGLESLAKVMAANISRLDAFWPAVHEHLVFAANHSAREVRSLAISTYLATLSAGVSWKATDAPPSPGPKSAKEPVVDPFSSEVSPIAGKRARALSQPPVMTEEALRALLLAPLDQFAAGLFADSREGLLTGLFQLLQSVGHGMGPHLDSIISSLDVFASVPDSLAHLTSKDLKAALPLAFHCLEFLVSDLLTTMEPSTLALLTSSVGAYGVQVLDMNISLTALNLLWRIADHLATLSGEAGLDPDTLQDLWLALFSLIAYCLHELPPPAQGTKEPPRDNRRNEKKKKKRDLRVDRPPIGNSLQTASQTAGEGRTARYGSP